MRARIFNIMQFEYHPETGEVLLLEPSIKECVAHKTIKRWAYILHDNDVYSEKDEIQDPRHKAGTKKPRHWHIVIEAGTNLIEIATIARWLGISENYIDVPKGRGAFLDCVQYLTHEREEQQLLGKRLYNDEAVHANFDFRAELNLRAERRLRYGRDLDEKDRVRNEVLFHGMSLRDVVEKYPLQYQNDFTYLQRCRLQYIEKVLPMPSMRMNIYVEGAGGIGKGLISKAIARSLIDKDNTMYDDEIYFEVGADKTTFEGYDGQPVIIWNDCRAFTLLEKLGGRENVFNNFDPFPPKIKQNIKYGSILLKNSINIVNSVQSWREFLDGLAGEYKDKNGEVKKAEDKSQSYRRFPFFLVLHEDDYDLGMNKGLFDGTREFEQYYTYAGIKANFRRIADACGDNLQLTRKINDKAVQLVADKYADMTERLKHSQRGTDEEILEQFKDVGTISEG